MTVSSTSWEAMVWALHFKRGRPPWPAHHLGSADVEPRDSWMGRGSHCRERAAVPPVRVICG